MTQPYWQRLLVWGLAAVVSLAAVVALLLIRPGTAVSSAGRSAQNWTAVFSETFESPISSTWQISDTDGISNGEYYWATTDVTASQGISSIWTSGGGADGSLLQPGVHHYPPNAASRMLYGPLNLSGTIAVSLTFDAWLHTEPVSDSLQVLVSADGLQYDQVIELSGNSLGWQPFAADLDSYAGQPHVWLAFQFSSDAVNQEKGVFLDNIALYTLDSQRAWALYLPSVQQIAAAEPTPSPIPAWLSYVNSFRAQAGLHPLDENSDWSSGDWLHSRYMVKNGYVGHDETPGNPWYTAEGQAAGQNGNVLVSSWVNTPDETAIDFWMTSPFHAIAILDPQLHSTGFGSYHEAIGPWHTGATLDVGRGRGDLPGDITFPIAFPSDGTETELLTHGGGEWPDPLASCPGYSSPAGPPLMLQLGSGNLTPNVTDFSLMAGDTLLESCLFDETSYTNPDPGTQATGRIILNSRDAVIIMPRHPLTAGQSYTVSVTADGQTTTWEFTAVAPSRPEQVPSQTILRIR